MSSVVLPSLAESRLDNRHRQWPMPHPPSGRPIIDVPPPSDAHGTSFWRTTPHTPPVSRPSPERAQYASPRLANGFPPSSAAQQPAVNYLPPLQSHTEPRSAAVTSAVGRPFPYDDRQPAPAVHPPHGYHDHHYAANAAHDHYYYSPRVHPHAPAPVAAPPVYQPDYRQHHPAYAPEYAQPAGDRPREAPRQRTSIACRYCRKRKIRCSGHQNAPGGKCHNCARMNQECIFQPVSSASSTAFIPVSAVPGGVPPGTQLFGSYGQPLPSTVPQQPQGPPPPQYAGPHRMPYYSHAVQSPTAPMYADRPLDEHVSLKRRRDSDEHSHRLPPPRPYGLSDERRSPAAYSADSSPRSLPIHRTFDAARGSPPLSGLTHPNPMARTGSNGYPYPPAGGDPHRSPLVRSGSNGYPYPVAGEGHRSPMARTGSNGSTSQGLPALNATQGANSVMKVSNLLGKTDIDQGMINKLNRLGDALKK